MNSSKLRVTLSISLLAVILLSGCRNGTNNESGGAGAPTASNNNASLNKADYAVFPDKDAGADPSVPAEQGGKGFTGEGWETNANFDLIGDPRAVKGGLLRDHLLDFPGTLRTQGPESNSAFNYGITSMV